MSLESVRQFFATHAPDVDVVVVEASSATVDQAASAYAVEPARIAKSLLLRVSDRVILLVTSGTAKLDTARPKTPSARKPPCSAAKRSKR